MKIIGTNSLTRYLSGAENFSLIALSVFAGKATAQSPDNKIRPNILIIIDDQQSANAMSCRLGEKYIKTPNMDWIANHGITFTHAYCANPLSIPSRTSMFTGLYPHETGIQTNEKAAIASKYFIALGKIFHDAGYETGYFGKWHVPFEAKDKTLHGFQIMAQIKNNGVDSMVPGAVISFLRQKHDKPFLAVASFVNPHNICEWARGQKLPDGDIGTAPPADRCPPLLSNNGFTKNESDIMVQLRKSMQASPLFPVGNFDSVKWRQYRWAYYRLIEKTDGQIGKILTELRSSGLAENTVILFLADHGDAQGAHRWNQKTVFFEEVVNVPFIISVPGMKKPEYCNNMVQTGIDLIPTLCDYAGIKAPVNLPGISARKVFETKNADYKRVYLVVEDKPVQGVAVNGVDPKPDGRMVRGNNFKYWIYSEGKQRESLFDMTNDPGEMVNLATDPKYSGTLKDYRKYLREFCEKYNDPFRKYLIN